MDERLDELDHPRIDDENVVDRYLAGRLSAEDEARFEEHLFACESCLAEVEAGEQLRRGLRDVAAQDAAVASLGLLAWWRRRSALARSALTTLALLVVLVPLIALWPSIGGGGEEAETSTPTADFLVVSLGVVRDGGGEVPTVRIDSERSTLLFSLELPTVASASYRVALLDAAGGVLWRADSIEPSLYDSLLVAVPSSFLAPGSYRIEVEGSDAADDFATAFRVEAD